MGKRFGRNRAPKRERGQVARSPPGRATPALSAFRTLFCLHFDSNSSSYPKNLQYIPLSADLISHRVFSEWTLFFTLFSDISTNLAMSSQWSTPRGGWPCGPSISPSTPSELYYSDSSQDPAQEDDYWKAKFEGAREMRKLEDPKLRNVVNWDLQAQIDLLHRWIGNEEAHSCGSRLHIKLL